MRVSWKAYWAGLRNRGWEFAGGAVLGLLGLALTIHPVAVPAWVWFLIAVAAVGWLGFVVFHDVRIERDKAVGVIEDLTRTPDLASDVRIEPSPNDGRPLIRLDLLPQGGQRIEPGALLNVLYPASWTTFEGCNSLGLYLFGGPAMRSDEPLPGDLEAKLWPFVLPSPLSPGITNILHFRVQGPPGRHQLIVRVPGTNLNATHTIDLPPQDPSPAHGLREKIDAMMKRGLVLHDELNTGPEATATDDEGRGISFPLFPPESKSDPVWEFDRSARELLAEYDPALLFAYAEGVDAAKRNQRRIERQRDQVQERLPSAEQWQMMVERLHRRPADELEACVAGLVAAKDRL